MSETSYEVMFHPVLSTSSDSNDDEVVLFTNRPLAGSPGNPHLRLSDPDHVVCGCFEGEKRVRRKRVRCQDVRKGESGQMKDTHILSRKDTTVCVSQAAILAPDEDNQVKAHGIERSQKAERLS